MTMTGLTSTGIMYFLDLHLSRVMQNYLMVVSKEADTSMRGRWGLSVPGPVGDHLMV